MKSNNNIVFNNIMFWFNINVEAFFSVKVVNKLKLAPPQGGLKMQVKLHNSFNATKEAETSRNLSRATTNNKYPCTSQNLLPSGQQQQIPMHRIQRISIKVLDFLLLAPPRNLSFVQTLLVAKFCNSEQFKSCNS